MMSGTVLFRHYSLAWVAPARYSLNQLQAFVHAMQQPCILVTEYSVDTYHIPIYVFSVPVSYLPTRYHIRRVGSIATVNTRYVSYST